MKKKEIIIKGEYAIGKNQQFVDKEGHQIRVSPNPVPIGEAYAFFYCDASKEEIEQELPAIREMTRTPSELELSLTNDLDSIKGDEKLNSIVEQAKDAGRNYVLQARYPNETNYNASFELGAILINAYNSSLWKEGEEYFGEVVYKMDDGDYYIED
ncbi:hypothetical protein J4461_01455 [Candidatus Pacearchaeota archaeon]|nr:hypothetical protein [Candidatus Pacearchaeota archaeon]